jgi:phosphohistidine phosphatase
MKNLFIIRHAKSSWEKESLHDIERPLAERGEKDATLIGKMLLKNGTLPQMVISSPALRAFSTARIICDEINFDKNKMVINNVLYFGDEDAIIELIRSFATEIDTAFIVGHNPTFSHLCSTLSEDFHSELPTCGIVVLAFNTGSWKLIEKHSGKLISYDYPKNYR